jgi:hypothetical protein
MFFLVERRCVRKAIYPSLPAKMRFGTHGPVTPQILTVKALGQSLKSHGALVINKHGGCVKAAMQFGHILIVEVPIYGSRYHNFGIKTGVFAL